MRLFCVKDLELFGQELVFPPCPIFVELAFKKKENNGAKVIIQLSLEKGTVDEFLGAKSEKEGPSHFISYN
jgi:hypothetical protein